MNQQGQILYLCNLHDKIDYERHHLCTIRADGSGSTDLTPSAKDITRGIDMNNAGQFVYECYPAICLGTINSDGSLAGEVQEIAQDGARYYAYPSLNDRGQMAFVCFDTAEGVDICAENLDQSNLVRLTKVTDGSISIYPVINDDGLIAYSCGSPDFSRVIDICVIRADGTAQRNLTDTQSLRYNRGQSMNNRGQMAFSCATPEERIRSNICAMNVDGSDWHQLTRHYGKTYYGSPSINGDGVIVYVCGVNLCIMNFDGSSQHQLTNFAGE
ncbi:hypothetical protein HY229_01165 [Candidatus Acetothermia bacterium]|nr:hypothetical protein [Candidatus Acetothermia bacterium]MBI3642698.1 hypothetical protein [Candidatus Acetothermia bacterium]